MTVRSIWTAGLSVSLPIRQGASIRSLKCDSAAMSAMRAFLMRVFPHQRLDLRSNEEVMLQFERLLEAGHLVFASEVLKEREEEDKKKEGGGAAVPAEPPPPPPPAASRASSTPAEREDPATFGPLNAAAQAGALQAAAASGAPFCPM